MKRIIALVVLSLFLITAVNAEAPTNKAIGYDSTVGGLSMRMLTASGIGVQGIVGLNVNAPAADGTQADLDLMIGVNVLKCLFEAEQGMLNAYAGIILDMDGSTLDGGDTVTDIALQAGLEPEIFLFDNLSISPKFGLQLTLQGDQRGGDAKTVTDTGATRFATFGQAVSVVGGASFNWYF